MDPIVLATVTASLTMLGVECAKGVAGAAGKDLWAKAKALLRIAEDPQPADLAPRIAEALLQDPAAVSDLVRILKTGASDEEAVQCASVLVGRIEGEKIVVASHLEVRGNFQM